ncbi:MAG: ribosomal protein S18-alanine N-acetyltransferase [Myxococcaceae bacterium]
MRELSPGQLNIRRMTLEDLPRVMAIEQVAFSNPWSYEMVKKELSHDWSTVLLAELGDELLGFAIFWLVVDELHVLNVATAHAHRRKGVAKTVMQAALDVGAAHRCRIATLEVRRGNQGAIALYSGLGFKPVGMRPAYYSDDREDAILMVKDF